MATNLPMFGPNTKASKVGDLIGPVFSPLLSAQMTSTGNELKTLWMQVDTTKVGEVFVALVTTIFAVFMCIPTVIQATNDVGTSMSKRYLAIDTCKISFTLSTIYSAVANVLPGTPVTVQPSLDTIRDLLDTVPKTISGARGNCIEARRESDRNVLPLFILNGSPKMANVMTNWSTLVDKMGRADVRVLPTVFAGGPPALAAGTAGPAAPAAPAAVQVLAATPPPSAPIPFSSTRKRSAPSGGFTGAATASKRSAPPSSSTRCVTTQRRSDRDNLGGRLQFLQPSVNQIQPASTVTQLSTLNIHGPDRTLLKLSPMEPVDYSKIASCYRSAENNYNVIMRDFIVTDSERVNWDLDTVDSVPIPRASRPVSSTVPSATVPSGVAERLGGSGDPSNSSKDSTQSNTTQGMGEWFDHLWKDLKMSNYDENKTEEDSEE